MNNKAFTLIELLAVVILLSIIVFLVLPNVVGLLKDKETEIDELTFTIIKDATKLYMEDNNELYDKKTGNQYCISLSELVGNEYLKDNIKYDGKDITNLMSIQVNYNGGYNYELVKNNDCVDNSKICKLISGEANKVGSKYECDLGLEKRNFYVLKPKNDSPFATLILEGNYDTTTQPWCNQSGPNPNNNVCAADGLTAKLDEILSVWTKLKRNQIGIPNALDIVVADGKSDNAYLETPALSNSWLYNWPGNEDYNSGSKVPEGYWTSNPHADYPDRAWFVYYEGYITYSSYTLVNNGSIFGVRPVITVNL